MRNVILLGSVALLAGCVAQPLPPEPYQLQAAPPLPYETEPLYRPPLPAPQNAPSPMPLITPDSPTPAAPSGSDDSGAIPLQDMPAPAPDAGTGGPATGSNGGAGNDTGAITTPPQATAPSTPSRMPQAASPVAGRGGNVPLEGFRPMRTQTQPTP